MLPERVRINEEGPREGFQSEAAPVPTGRKIELIDRLSRTGLKHIRVASFVNPKRVPGMADADAVVAGYERVPGVRYEALWLNDRGFERAVRSGRLDIRGNVSISASEALLIRNQNRTQEQHVGEQHAAMALYRAHGVDVRRATIQAAFGCNFSGPVEIRKVIESVALAKSIAGQHGYAIEELVLADSMAWATPRAIKAVVDAVKTTHPELDITLHLHDTRGMAIANAYAGLEMGVCSFDASIAGLGGCPFAGHKGAAGNICTEDLAFMCEEMGIETGLDLDALIDAARLAEEIVGRPLPGSVMRGGPLRHLRVQRA